ncbi:MAG: hypothetical protein RLZZ214_397 [Verrucomicrobiota bacterium]|jgi:hypothetical protein
MKTPLLHLLLGSCLGLLPVLAFEPTRLSPPADPVLPMLQRRAAPIIKTDPMPPLPPAPNLIPLPPPLPQPAPQPAVPVQGRSRPINPTMTAQKFMRHYQPTEEEQMAAEMRRYRQQRLMDDQRRDQEQAEMQRRLHQLEQARIIEAQRRQMEEFRRQNSRYR